MLQKKTNITKLNEYANNENITMLTASDGNLKLVPDKHTAFLIWNLPAVITCPYATEHCKAACYARKAEKGLRAGKVVPARTRNFLDSRRADFRERMLYTILYRRQHTNKRWLIVRIHESGDFYNRQYTQDWLWIAMQCRGEKIKFIAYTKSFVFFDGIALPDNFFLRASIWDDTPSWQLEIIKRNNWPTYTAVDKFRTGDNFTRCRCKDCASCGKCWKNYQDIRCEIH